MSPAATQPPGRLARLRGRVAALGPAGPLLLWSMTVPLLGTTVLVATSADWTPWFGNDPWSAAGFVPLGAFCVAAALLPTHVTSLAAGFLFGGLLGALTAWLVAGVGAVLGHGLLQPLLAGRALRALAAAPRALAVHQALLGRGPARSIWIVALLRLSPVMPFATTNLLLAAFGVGLGVSVVATALGMAPRAIAAAVIGAGLQEFHGDEAASPWTTAFAIVATVVAIVVIGRIARAALRAELAAAAPRPH